MSVKSEVIKGIARFVGQNKQKVVTLLNENGYPTRKSIPVKDLMEKLDINLRTDHVLAKELTAMAFPDIAKASAKGLVLTDSYDGSKPRVTYATNNVVVNSADGSEEVVSESSSNGYGQEAKVQIDPLEAATQIVKTTLASQSAEDKLVTAAIATEQDEKQGGLMGLYTKYPVASLAVVIIVIGVVVYYASKWLGIVKK